MGAGEKNTKNQKTRKPENSQISKTPQLEKVKIFIIYIYILLLCLII